MAPVPAPRITAQDYKVTSWNPPEVFAAVEEGFMVDGAGGIVVGGDVREEEEGWTLGGEFPEAGEEGDEDLVKMLV